MKKNVTIGVLASLLLTVSVSYGQIMEKIDKTKYKYFEYNGYDRKAFTILYVNNQGDKDSEKIGKNFSFSYEDFTGRFDYNVISLKKLDGNFETKNDKLTLALNNQKIPNKVMDYLMDEGGWKIPLETLNKRATANKTDAERQLFEKTFAGKNINDLASDFYEDINPVIQSNYIMLLSAGNVRTYRDYYDEIDKKEKERVANYNKNLKSGEGRIEFKPVQRKYDGYMAALKYYVYNIDLKNDSTLSVFWNMCYSDASFRNNYTYSLKLIAQGTQSIESKQDIDCDPKYKRSMDELYKTIMTSGNVSYILGNTLPELNEFKIMLSIYEDNPISLKIGKQEDLKKDSRYNVYIRDLYKKDQVRWKRQGVIRARKVTNNKEEKIQDKEKGIKIDEKKLAYKYTTEKKTDTTKTWVLQGRYVSEGEVINNGLTKSEIKIKRGLDKDGMMIPSTFYQTEGKKIEGLGTMLAIEQPSLNLFLSPSYGTHGLNIDISYLESGFQYFLNFGFDGYKFKDEPYIYKDSGDSLKTNVSLFNIYFGVSKDFHFMRNFVFAPHLALGAELASFSNKELDEIVKKHVKDKYKEDSYGMSNTTFNVGAQLGYTIFHSTKAFAGIDYFPISYKKNKIFGPNGDFYEIKRSPVRIYFGLRFEI